MNSCAERDTMTSNGYLLIDKPQGITSHTVVSKVRRILGERRIGHAGTLDPMATGLLVLGVGPATRLLQYCQESEKTYTGTVRLGETTSSLDADSPIIATALIPPLLSGEVNDVAATMWGTQQQIPPMVSALQQNGKRLYDLAREGIEVERAPRTITVRDFTLTPREGNDWDFVVTCSVGTYVRVLLSDLAERLGTVGHLVALRRVRSGRFHVENAWQLDDLDDAVNAGQHVLGSPLEMVTFPRVVGSSAQIRQLRMGQRPALATTEEIVAVTDEAGEFIALARRRDDAYQPTLVMPSVDQ